MVDPKDERKLAKAKKKLAKKDVKAQKKAAVASMSKPDRPEGGPTSLTPSERSAAAAERQVKINQWRMVIGLLMLLIAALTLAWKANWFKQEESQDAASVGVVVPGVAGCAERLLLTLNRYSPQCSVRR